MTLGRLVAFQYGAGTPWRLFGPKGNANFRWDKLPNNKTSRKVKQAIQADLEHYASKHGIPLAANSSVKMALLGAGNIWVSNSGGISSNLLT